jgi:plastocyanin
MPSRARGRRLGLVAALAAIAALLAAASAFGVTQTIVGTDANVFTQPVYVSDQGEVTQLQVTGGTHNVTARDIGPDGKALFRSRTISGGSTPVDGTQFVPAGSYAFLCTIHPDTMQGTLQVTGNGSPKPRPQMTLAIRSKKVSKVAKKGLLVQLDLTAKSDEVSLEAKLGKATIGTLATTSFAAGRQFAVVKITKAGKAKLAGRKKATVGVVGDIAFGSPATAKGKLTK